MQEEMLKCSSAKEVRERTDALDSLGNTPQQRVSFAIVLAAIDSSCNEVLHI